LSVDGDYVKTFGMEIVAGRNFSSDLNALLINETAVAAMGWGSPENAIGKKIKSPSGYPRGTVVGVVKDYHHHALRKEILPSVFDINEYVGGFFAIKIISENISEVISHMEKTWQQFFPGYSFSYFFLDEDFARQYQTELRLVKIFASFASLGILIACLGLFGLVAFTTAQRTKEIGLRKTLGATTLGIVVMLTGDFLKLIGAAFFIAIPIAYYAMNRWLSGFAYRISIGWDILLLSGVFTITIALITIVFHVVKATLSNPVDSLKYE